MTCCRGFGNARQRRPGKRWYEQLMSKIDTLENNPQRCSLAAESQELELELRELLFGRRLGVYRILFIVDRNVVQVLRIRHAMRDSLSPADLQ